MTAAEGAGDVVRWCCGGSHVHLRKGAVYANLPAHLHDDLAAHLHDADGAAVFGLSSTPAPGATAPALEASARVRSLRASRNITEEETLAMGEVLRRAVEPTEAQRLLTAYRIGRRDGERRWRSDDAVTEQRYRTAGRARRAVPTEPTDPPVNYVPLDRAERQAIYDARDEDLDGQRVIGVLPADVHPAVIAGLLARGLVCGADDSDEPARWLLTVRGLAVHYRMRQTSEGARGGG